MYGQNLRSPKVDIHRFTMIPRAEIPRSRFKMQHTHKTTFSASYLIPIYVQEVLPGDTFNVKMSVFARLATPIVPIMDNMDLESWFFFVPCRLTWQHWVNFMGEQPASPTDSISYSIPTVTTPTNGWAATSPGDYMGCPTIGQLTTTGSYTHNVLPLRAYNIIWSTWFRDENLLAAATTGATQAQGDIGDGPDPSAQYANCLQLAKRHDYFTSCLPWTQKGGVPISFLSGQATVKTAGSNLLTGAQSNSVQWLGNAAGATPAASVAIGTGASGLGTTIGTAPAITAGAAVYPANLYADLTTATTNTINALRLAFQTQKLLERDARGGTRYTEIVRSHFGVVSPDMRLQRPELLGTGKTPLSISPVPQTSATGLTGGTTPTGSLAAAGIIQSTQHGYSGSFTEHGYVIGLVGARADQTYQQGVRRLFSRSTRYDFYFPVFATLGEQAVRNDELYVVGSAGPAGQDSAAYGFMERWAEYRNFPSFTSGFFRSTNSTPLDVWHLGIKFTSLPVLNPSMINDQTSLILERNLAGGAATIGQQVLADFFFDETAARPMPMYSVPGLIDHF